MSTGSGAGRRAFGFGGEGNRATRTAHQRFEALTEQADDAGVAWRDLVQDGYRAPGDLHTGGLTVRVDWAWRADELERRLRLRPPDP